MPQARLKSSFIYLANAVNDLRGNWRTFALVLAPLVLLGGLCLLPDALNLQHALAQKFTPGTRSIGWVLTQSPYSPATQQTAVLARWVLILSELLLLVLALGVNLVVLCTIRHDRSGVKHERILDEALAIYSEVGKLALGFYWIVLLQLMAPLLAIMLLSITLVVSQAWLLSALYIFEVSVVVGASLIYLWLYFAPYALVFHDQHSFHGLLFSRDLMRKRFFRVATRIVVFLAVWSGYNSWAAGAFIFVSVVLGPIGALTGYLWATIVLLALAITAVTYATTAFFAAAGARLYQDVAELTVTSDARATEASTMLPSTVSAG